MCGIFVSCSPVQPVLPEDELLNLLDRRGPDSLRVVHRITRPSRTTNSPVWRIGSKIYHLVFISSVLSLRSTSTVAQPLIDEGTGSVLCWNGEAWKLHDELVLGNDAQVVFEALLGSTKSCSIGEEKFQDRTERIKEIGTVLRAVSGPFAFAFYDASFNYIFYGRDMMGRRSLLNDNSSSETFVISSVCQGSAFGSWEEVQADGIYILDLERDNPTNRDYNQVGPVRKRDRNSVVFVPWSEAGAATGPIVPSAQDAIAQKHFPTINRDLVPAEFSHLGLDSSPVATLGEVLRISLALRVKNILVPPGPTQCATCIAILFSGGLDCTVLARLIHEILPLDRPIDLLNVAFENPRVITAALAVTLKHTADISAYTSPYNFCPDRITGLRTYEELLQVCPGREWRFISIDVPYTETIAHRSQIISLIHPHDTEMDLSIACALYFAARGRGSIRDATNDSSSGYTTPARILISGLGADELFGGYSRHAVAFSRRGRDALLDELELDFRRLGERNLGRDDRVISHWGKEARYPYLDEDLVRWTLKRPLHEKCAFGQQFIKGDQTDAPPALGSDKFILRLLAMKLGMRIGAREKKRAIQFGARTAKMEIGTTKGSQTISTATAPG
ncbi:hypothetical protein MMC19_001024 [Ptychographa xylographoides]|nr:hypothetical protein [Ptychographa xylographoides]